VHGLGGGRRAAGAALAALVNAHGQGRCAITLDPQDRLPGQQPYQGIVPLHATGASPAAALAQVLEHYMLQSEQLDTRLVLAADDERGSRAC
jgi:molecular chaperone Hsp33